MKTAGELHDFLTKVIKEYGRDASIVLQVYDYEHMLHGDYCLSFRTSSSGSVFLLNTLDLGV